MESITARPLVVLNMIVKNESHIICRLLESCLPFIDGYVILDTGSIDNTPQLIRDFFAKHPVQLGGSVILGGTHIDPSYKFNFARARNESLAHCAQIMGGKADYILLMDADMQLVINDPTFSLPSWGGTNPPKAYHLVQSTGGANHAGFFNPNVRIIPLVAVDIGAANTRYFGYTHEYISQNYETANIPRNVMYIADIGDGGSKSNKHLRDIELCIDGIEHDVPHMRIRYVFYLAESYRYYATTLHATPDEQRETYQKAIDSYRERISLGQWEQEVWYSYYAIGKCYMGMNEPEKAVYWWLLGYEYYPHRIEGLYQVIQHYRNTYKHKLALFYYSLADRILREDPLCNTVGARESMLFMENDVYTHLLLFEYTIIAHYLGVARLEKEIVQILNAADANVCHGVLFNMQFNRHICLDNGATTRTLYKSITNPFAAPFINSSASIIPFSSGPTSAICYLMNLRGVNYRIDHKTGAYTMLDVPEGTDLIVTQNMRLFLDAGFNIVDAADAVAGDGRLIKMTSDVVNSGTYRGIEDVRIFAAPTIGDKSPIFFMGTHFYNGKLGIAFGEYPTNVDTTSTTVCNITAPFAAADRQCEKNWVFVNMNNEPCVIYEWYNGDGNISICDIGIIEKDDSMIIEPIATRPMPAIFKYARGSTNAATFIDSDGNKENWFIVHFVDTISAPRHYYHMFVVMDADMNLKRYSAPFTFETGCAIEYCLSVLVNNDTVTVCYSTWDSSTAIASYKKTYIDGLLTFCP